MGPETFTFVELVKLIRAAVGSRAAILRMPPWLILLTARLLGRLLRDVLLTRDELDGLMAGLLVSADSPTGHIALTSWLQENGQTLGARYASELARHY